ncbi:MAG TPA: CotH kinase family protein [Polyangiales bacterium]|nr:CotH kinase family protein [Polyangiales bacterium]
MASAFSACLQAEDALEQPITELPPMPPTGPCEISPEEDLTLELPTWDLQVSQAAWDRLHEDVLADVEVPAAVCVQGRSYNIELELQGSSTRKLAKKSFDLKWKRANPLQTWPYDDAAPSEPVAIRKLFLKAMAKDQSLVREALGFDLYRALGYATPHTGFANLRINGAYWGLYAVIEPVNEAYLAARDYPAGGRLYKAVRKHGSRADFAPGRDLTRAFETELTASQAVADEDRGVDEDIDVEEAGPPDMDVMEDGPESAEPEAAEPSDLPNEYAELEHLVEVLQDTPLDEGSFEAQIDPLFSLEACFDRMLWVAFTQNGDAIAQNFFLYHAGPLGSDHWYQIPWDSDISFGADYRDVESVIDTATAPLVDGGNYFSKRMLKIASLRARYAERFRDVLNERLLEAEAFARLSAYRDRLSNDLTHNQIRWKRHTESSTVFDRLDAFISERGAVLQRALAAF